MSGVLQIGNSALGSALEQFLMADDIVPGSMPGYELCKLIYIFHPLGDKIAAAPIRQAQSQEREIAVPDGPEDDCRRAFIEQWDRDGCDNVALNIGTQARVYGVASLAAVEAGVAPSSKLDLKNLYRAELAYNVLDPLNTAGSLVTNQDPNAVDFQKHRDIRVAGIIYDRSRTVTLLNENPIYIAFSASAFGFTGRSVYQRPLFPLKTFVQSMRSDDMVVRKTGIIVAMMRGAGSIVDAMQDFVMGARRRLLRQGTVEDVISVDRDDKVESLDLSNLAAPMLQARKNVLENVASAVPMPAKMINNETFAEGFGEGSEDAKHVAEYIDGIRRWLKPVYALLDDITMRRAWNPTWYKIIQAKYPDPYASMDYETAFYRWKNSFAATWPSLLREPDSELVKVDEIKFKTAVGAFEVLEPVLDPENKSELLKWFCDALNDKKRMFSSPLNLDFTTLQEFLEKNAEQMQAMREQGGDGGDEEQEPKPPRPMADGAGAQVVGLDRRVRDVEGFLARNGRGMSQAARAMRGRA